MQRSLLVFAVMMATLVLTAELSYLVTIQQTGVIASVDLAVYSDGALTQPLTSIDWGVLEVNSTADKSLWIKNVGSVNVVLDFTTKNYVPVEADKIFITADYVGNVVSPSAFIRVVVTIHIPADLVGVTNYSFDLVVASSSN